MKANDLPYQTLITDRILEQKRTNIWAPMGMGKSRAVLKAVDVLQLTESSPTLVLAPYRVANSTWPDEARRWDDLQHLTVTPILGTPEERLRALRADTPVFSINDENIPWLVEQFARRPWPFRTVVRDEATRFKGHRLKQGSKRSQGIAKLAFTQIDRWVNLTGTPSPNGLKDLWGQNYFVDQGQRLGYSFDAFHQRWFSTFSEKRPTKNGKWTFSVPVTVPREGADAEIHARLADVCMSLDPKDWFDLHEPLVREVRVILPEKARRHYREMEKKMFTELDGHGVEALNAAGKTIKCLQIASGFLFTDGEGAYSEVHDAKLQALESIVEEAAGASVLVSYWFKPSLARLLKAFPKGRVLDKDPQTIRDWNAGKIPILFAHPMCLHPRTEVLTECRGWVRIVDVKKNDRVFDGVEFVSHSGCSFSGFRSVIDVFGVTLTPNHRLLIDGEWIKAEDVRDSENLRRKARYIYTGADSYTSEMLSVRRRANNPVPECRARQQDAPRTLPVVPNSRGALYDQYSVLVDMASHGKSSDQSERSRLQTLRSRWTRYLRGLVGFQELLSGYVSGLPRRSDDRAKRQHQGLQQGELSLGNQRRPAVEQEQQSSHPLSRSRYAPRGVLSPCGSGPRSDYPEVKQRLECGAGTCGLREVELPGRASISDVYDLVDCGPRHQFVIRNSVGEVFISHNSAGHGLNMAEGGHIIAMYESWWDLETWLQILERIGPVRQAQLGPDKEQVVMIYTIVAEDTVDEVVLERHRTKQSTQQLLMAYMKRKK